MNAPDPEQRILNTDRLTLRKLALRDAQGVFDLRNNTEASALIGRPLWDSIGQAEEYIASRIQDIDDGDCFYWSIYRKDEDGCGPESDATFVGTMCLWNFEAEKNRAEIGYELLPKFHGQGYASEALQAVIDHGFEELDLAVIEAVYFNLDNVKSIALLERNGFIYEGDRFDESEGKPSFIYSLKRASD